MKTLLSLIALTASAFIFMGNAPKAEPVGAPVAIAEIFPSNGSSIKGNINFRQKSNRVIMQTELTGFMREGLHAVSLHIDGVSPVGVVGRDINVDVVDTHWNPTGKPHGAHGEVSPNGDPQYHRGDIGNIKVDGGIVKVKFSNQEWTLDNDPMTGILGKVIAIHERPDDFKTQPDGGAGKIIAFGKIKLKDSRDSQTSHQEDEFEDTAR